MIVVSFVGQPPITTPSAMGEKRTAFGTLLAFGMMSGRGDIFVLTSLEEEYIT